MRMVQAAGLALLWMGAVATAQDLVTRVIADGLKEPMGVALHPDGNLIYISEKGSGRILAMKPGGRPEPVLAAEWSVSTNLPRWAFSDRIPAEKWFAAQLEQPGAMAVATNGHVFVTEQVPNGRLLEFIPNEEGLLETARGVPVPWLDQEFQWRNITVDRADRLYIVGADEIGSDFMKFGSALMRETDSDWWVIDFGPFADFRSLALSERQDALLLGDHNKGALSWWEVNRHVMLGGAPDTVGRADLVALAFYPDGSYVLGVQTGPNQASLMHMDPFSGQQRTLSTDFKSIGAIAMDRPNARYFVTDPVAGRVVECTFSPPVRFNEAVMRQIVRSVDGMLGGPTEAPAFLNNFMERLQDASRDILTGDTTHGVQFNLSDIAGKMPIVAGRIRATVEVEGAEDDPLEQVDFFLLFPSKVVMTDTAVSPSLSFFSARRKSGKLEQTKPLFQGDVSVHRVSGTNYAKVTTAPGGLHVPIVVCGMEQTEEGISVNLSFLGAGVYGDYYVNLFQGPREQKAKLVVKSAASPSGNVSYDAFVDDMTVEGMDGKITKEQYSNLLISGFGGGSGANRSVGWLRLGQFPAAMTVAFGDADDTKLTGAASDLREIVEKKRLERSIATASDIEDFDGHGADVDKAGEQPQDESPEEATP